MSDKMTEGHAEIVGTPGERCTNPHFDDRFTCPECLTDHTLTVGRESVIYHDCSCGARLRCTVDYVPESICQIADPDEVDEAA